MTKARYDNIGLSAVFSASLDVFDQTDGYAGGGGPPPPWPRTFTPPLDAIVFSTAGAEVALTMDDPAATLYDAKGPDPGGGGPGEEWLGTYIRWKVKAQFGLSSDEFFLMTHLEDGFITFPPGPYPLPGPEVGGTFSVDATSSISDLFMKGEAIDATPAERGFMWFGDRGFEESWFADEGSLFSVTATSSGESATASGVFADAGNEFEFGVSYGNTVHITMDHFHTSGKMYARVSDWIFGDGDAVDLSNLLLYDPGTEQPNADGWGRVRTGTDNAIMYDNGGAAMRYDGASPLVTSGDWTGVVLAPFQVAFKPLQGKFGYH